MKNLIKKLLKENLEEKNYQRIIKDAINFFKSKIKIFDKINVELVDRTEETVGEYEHDSVFTGIPTIYINKVVLNSLSGEDLVFAIRTTIFHELGHALCNIDNTYIFVKDDNILHYEDEEDFVENFAVELNDRGIVPEEILKLANLYRNKKWIAIDDQDY
jgi:hypothetical protein